MKMCFTSHFLLISQRHTRERPNPRERECVSPVTVSRSKFASILLAATLLLAAAPAWSEPEKGGGGKPDTDRPDRERNDNARGRRTPTTKVQGGYAVKIAGYYTGSGKVAVDSGGVTIEGTVIDPRSKSYALKAGKLEVVEDRFRGEGTLGDMTITIDGRVDPEDPQDPEAPKGPGNSGEAPGRSKNRVLIKGRVTFTFSTHTSPSHRARGAGEMRSGG